MRTTCKWEQVPMAKQILAEDYSPCFSPFFSNFQNCFALLFKNKNATSANISPPGINLLIA